MAYRILLLVGIAIAVLGAVVWFIKNFQGQKTAEQDGGRQNEFEFLGAKFKTSDSALFLICVGVFVIAVAASKIPDPPGGVDTSEIPPSRAGAQSLGFKIYHNKDLLTPDIYDSKGALSESEISSCQMRCENDDKCMAFVFLPRDVWAKINNGRATVAGPRCWLKADSSQKTSDVAGLQLGIRITK